MHGQLECREGKSTTDITFRGIAVHASIIPSGRMGTVDHFDSLAKLPPFKFP